MIVVRIRDADNERNINGYIDVIELRSSRSMVGGGVCTPDIGGREDPAVG